jgi:hypothetical protein
MAMKAKGMPTCSECLIIVSEFFKFTMKMEGSPSSNITGDTLYLSYRAQPVNAM